MCKKVNEIYKKFYLDRPNWIDGTTQFKMIIQSYLRKEFEILDIGAGKGSVHNYREAVKKVIGIDVSSEVLLNPNLDEAYECPVTDMPFEDDRFDLAYADWLLEHLSEPVESIKEIYRVLKPSGILVIRTPNLWHYVSLISHFMPYRFHIFFLKILQDKDKKDTFKTYYHCNNILKIKQVFEKVGFIIERLELVEKEPSYLMKWNWIFIIGLFYERMVNSIELFRHFRANIFAVFRKPKR